MIESDILINILSIPEVYVLSTSNYFHQQSEEWLLKLPFEKIISC